MSFLWTIRLIFILVLDLFSVSFAVLLGRKTIWLSLVFVTMVASLLIFDPPQSPQEPIIDYQVDQQAAEQHIAFWTNMVSITPNRDSFLNLELLHKYLEETDIAEEYRHRAFLLDPNNPEFDNDIWEDDSDMK